MNNNNRMIPRLYTLLTYSFEKRQTLVPQRVLSDSDRQCQGLALTHSRYFVAILENHILDCTGSVIFTVEAASDSYTLRFHRPLTAKEYDKLAASGYVPVLRSKVYLSVGIRKCEDLCYAFSEVKLSQYASVMDMFDGLFVLDRELELLLLQIK